MSDNFEQYLEHQVAAGRPAESGTFELHRKSALEKISAFQLPDNEAWSLKLVQTAIATGQCESLDFLFSRKTIILRCHGVCLWSPEDIEKTFWEPEPTNDRALNHLKTALWNIGIHQRRSFEISWPGMSETLLWTGTELIRGKPKKAVQCLEILVAHQPFNGTKGWWARIRRVARQNSGVNERLATKAYACPVPIRLDSRRIDDLSYCPGQGLNAWSYPIGVAFVEEGEPKLTLPQDSFAPLTWRRKLHLHKALREFSSENLQNVPAAKRVWMTALLAVHLGHEVQGKTRYFKCIAKRSVCNWVLDGVLVHSHFAIKQETTVSTAFFLSAEGLKTDLTTLSLAQSAEWTARFRKAVFAMDEVLRREWPMDLNQILEQETKENKTGGAFIMGLGTFMMVLPPLGLFLMWAGRKQWREAGDVPQKVVNKALGGLSALRDEWSELTDHWKE